MFSFLDLGVGGGGGVGGLRGVSGLKLQRVSVVDLLADLQKQQHQQTINNNKIIYHSNNIINSNICSN